MKTFTVHMNMLIEMGCLLQSVGADKASRDYSGFLCTQFDQQPFHKTQSPSLSSNKCFLPPSHLGTVAEPKNPSPRAWNTYQEGGSARDTRAPRGSNRPGQSRCVMFFYHPLFPHPRGLAVCALG